MHKLDFDLRIRIAGTTRCAAAAAGFAALILAGCGDSGADRQKEAAEIAKGIEDYLALIETPSEPMHVRHDKVTVTPAEDGKTFAVAITGVRYGTDKDDVATFGEIDYRLTPQGEDQYQVGDLKMPAEIRILQGEAKDSTVRFETTGFSATWSKPLHNFLKLEWQVKDIMGTAAAQPGGMFKIATASLVTDGKENGKGLIDQVSKITLDGLTIADPTEGTTVKLDKLLGNVSIEKLDFPAYRQLVAKVGELSAKYQPQAAAGGAPATPPAITDEDRKALAEMVRGVPKLFAAYGYDFSGEGLTVTDAQDGSTVHVTQGGIAFGVKDIDSDKAQANFSIRHDGLTVSDPAFQDPMAKAVLPKSGGLSLRATDIPVPSLLEGVAQALPEMTSSDPQVAQGGQFMMMGALMSALSKSTLKLEIEPSAIQTEVAKLSADGELKLAMESPQKTVGVVNFALLGLDDLIALAKSMADQSPDAQQAMGMLAMLQALSQRDAGTDGKPVDKYKVELTPTGSVLVNGKPMDGMMP